MELVNILLDVAKNLISDPVQCSILRKIRVNPIIHSHEMGPIHPATETSAICIRSAVTEGGGRHLPLGPSWRRCLLLITATVAQVNRSDQLYPQSKRLYIASPAVSSTGQCMYLFSVFVQISFYASFSYSLFAGANRLLAIRKG